METIHPYMLCYSLLLLFTYAAWAGGLYPFLRYVCRLRWFATGYSQQPKPLTTAFALLTAAAIPLVALAVVSEKHHYSEAIKPSIFFPQLWHDTHYWTRITSFQPQYQVFWYLYISLSFAMLLQVCFVLLHKADLPGPNVTEPAPDNHAFIIVAHNSSDILEHALTAILKLVRPFQIYIADNGSTPDEERLTDMLCKRLSDAYYTRNPMLRPVHPASSRIDIQVAHIPVGNKTLAQYATIHFLSNELRAGRCRVNRVTIIDDDVIVPPYWSSARCDELMDTSKGTVALGYPLSASNADETCCAGLQNLEYLGGNVARYTQDRLGSQLWASGAIATWTIEVLEQILERHCTVFNGEDLEMGYLLHTLRGLDGDKLGTPGPYRIGWYQECLVPTAVPPCVMHWYDWIPVQYKKKYKFGCKCGEHSFFNQRLRSWDPASHQYLVKFLHIVFSRGAYTYSAKTFVRFLCSWKLINLAREYALFITIIVSFSRVRNGADVSILFAFYTDTLLIGWAMYATIFMLTSFSLWRVRQALPPDFCLAYPIIYDFPYVLFVRFVVVGYTYLYYLFNKPFPRPIREQLKTDHRLCHILTTAWESKETMEILPVNNHGAYTVLCYDPDSAVAQSQVGNPFDPEMTERMNAVAPTLSATATAILKSNDTRPGIVGSSGKGSTYPQTAALPQILGSINDRGSMLDIVTVKGRSEPVISLNRSSTTDTVGLFNEQMLELRTAASSRHRDESPTAPLLRQATSIESLALSDGTIAWELTPGQNMS